MSVVGLPPVKSEERSVNRSTVEAAEVGVGAEARAGERCRAGVVEEFTSYSLKNSQGDAGDARK